MTQEFGRVLKALREDKRWSLAQLARLAHTSASHLGNVERGVREPSEAVVTDLDAALDAQGRLQREFRRGVEPAPTEDSLVDVLRLAQQKLSQLVASTDELHHAFQTLTERIASGPPEDPPEDPEPAHGAGGSSAPYLPARSAESA